MDIEATQQMISCSPDSELFAALAKLHEFEPADAELIGDLARAELRARGFKPEEVPAAVARILNYGGTHALVEAA